MAPHSYEVFQNFAYMPRGLLAFKLVSQCLRKKICF